MRIKINGNDDLSRFHALSWAKKWVATGHLRADELGGERKGVKKEEKREAKKNYQSDLF